MILDFQKTMEAYKDVAAKQKPEIKELKKNKNPRFTKQKEAMNTEVELYKRIAGEPYKSLKQTGDYPHYMLNIISAYKSLLSSELTYLLANPTTQLLKEGSQVTAAPLAKDSFLPKREQLQEGEANKERENKERERKEREKKERERKENEHNDRLRNEKENYDRERKERERKQKEINDRERKEKERKERAKEIAEAMAQLKKSDMHGSTLREYRRQELNLIIDDNKELISEKERLTNLNNELAYKAEIISSALLAKQNEKCFLVEELRRKQAEFNQIRRNRVGVVKGSIGINNTLTNSIQTKEEELKKYQEKYKRMMQEYTDFTKGKDRNGNESRPFYNPPSHMKGVEKSSITKSISESMMKTLKDPISLGRRYETPKKYFAGGNESKAFLVDFNSRLDSLLKSAHK